MSANFNNNIAQAIYLEIKGKNKDEQSVVFPKIIQFLVKKRLLSNLPDIFSRLSKIANREEGRVVAKVYSEKTLSEKTVNELKHSLLKKYIAKEVEIILKTDPRLIGGLRVEVGDEVIDLTTKNKIKKLQEYLIKSV